MNPITAPELLRKAADLIDSGESPFPTDAICQAAGLDKTQDDTSRCSSYRFRHAATLIDKSQCWSLYQKGFYQKAIEVVAATKKRALGYIKEYTDMYLSCATVEELTSKNETEVKPELNAYTNQVLLVSEVFGVPEETVCDDVCDIVDGNLPNYEPEANEQPERKEPSEMLREVIERYAEQTLKEDEVEDESYICVGELETLSEAVKAYYEVAR